MYIGIWLENRIARKGNLDSITDKGANDHIFTTDEVKGWGRETESKREWERERGRSLESLKSPLAISPECQNHFRPNSHSSRPAKPAQRSKIHFPLTKDNVLSLSRVPLSRPSSSVDNTLIFYLTSGSLRGGVVFHYQWLADGVHKTTHTASMVSNQIINGEDRQRKHEGNSNCRETMEEVKRIRASSKAFPNSFNITFTIANSRNRREFVWLFYIWCDCASLGRTKKET